MGKSVITVEAYGAKESVEAAARKAVEMLRGEGISLSAASHAHHPGEADESSVDLLAEPAPAGAEHSATAQDSKQAGG